LWFTASAAAAEKDWLGLWSAFREREKGSRNFYSWMVQWLETDVKMAHFTYMGLLLWTSVSRVFSLSFLNHGGPMHLHYFIYFFVILLILGAVHEIRLK